MNDMDYKPNSHISKATQQAVHATKPATTEKRVNKTVGGKVKTKKNEVRKLTDVFISEDIHNVKNYIWMDIIVPAIKKAIVDTITDSVTMIFGTSPHKNGSTAPKVSYRDYRDYSNPRGTNYVSTSNAHSRFDYDDLVFETRIDAETTLDEMCNVIDRYQVVTVADMYDIAQLSPPYTSNKYGWTNLSMAEIVRLRDGGWVIKLPKAGPV